MGHGSIERSTLPVRFGVRPALTTESLFGLAPGMFATDDIPVLAGSGPGGYDFDAVSAEWTEPAPQQSSACACDGDTVPQEGAAALGGGAALSTALTPASAIKEKTGFSTESTDVPDDLLDFDDALHDCVESHEDLDWAATSRSV